MSDNSTRAAPIGHQIRLQRQRRGWTLAELARRAKTSAPSLHRYENGWDRFELETLRRIAAALGMRLEVQLVARRRRRRAAGRSAAALVRRLAPLFWDRDLEEDDLARHTGWVVERVIMSGSRTDVEAARGYFGDDAFRRAIARRGVDPRTRNYWRLILGEDARASQGA